VYFFEMLLFMLYCIGIMSLTESILMNGPDFMVWLPDYMVWLMTGLAVLIALPLVYITHWLATRTYETSSKAPLPTFDAWVDYCFTRGDQDFHADPNGSDYAVVQARSAPFLNIDPPVLANYVIALFENPEFIADKYTDDQIGKAVWFLFGTGSEYFYDLRSDDIEQSLQVRCICSVETLYLRLFDRVCCMRGKNPNGEYGDTEPDSAVSMIWDMGCMNGAIIDGKQWPHLVKPGLQVLENVLMKSRTSTCMVSALHGLGHILNFHPQHCKRIIDGFLAEREVPEHVHDYALAARSGCIL
jgi:hypothetical protein